MIQLGELLDQDAAPAVSTSSVRSPGAKTALFRSISCWTKMTMSLNDFLTTSPEVAPSPSLALLLDLS